MLHTFRLAVDWPMRDGIYKDLPLPRPWKSLMRACLRPAERGDTSRRLAEAALLKDATREVSKDFRRNLKALCEETAETLPGFATQLSVSSARDLGGVGSPLEQSILSAAQHLYERGACGEPLASQAMTEGLQAWRERQFRQLEQHGLAKAGQEAGPILRAAREAVNAIDVRAVAGSILGDDPKAAVKVREAINVDEDLRVSK